MSKSVEKQRKRFTPKQQKFMLRDQLDPALIKALERMRKGE